MPWDLAWRKLKSVVCKHRRDPPGISVWPLDIGEYTVLRKETIGVTLGWGATPEVQRKTIARCHLCGEEFAVRGYMPRDPDFKRDADGWPLNEDGSRMAIAKD